MTRETRRRLILSLLVISLLSGGCQGCARPTVKTALVKKGMTVAEAEAILGKAFHVGDMGPSPPLPPGLQLRIYRNGDNWVDVEYKHGIVEEVREHRPQPWSRLW